MAADGTGALLDLVDESGRLRLHRYRHVSTLGSGAFAEVSKHEDVDTGRAVAIKRVLRGAVHEGINLGAVKELQALPEVHHVNVLSLLDTFAYGDRVHLVLEYAVADLTALIRDRAVRLSEAAVKGYMLQILSGVAALHRAHWMHRDLKPDNVLITAAGVVKLADFGHATRFPLPGGGGRPRARGMHHNVVTLWYRPPELLFHATRYGPAVDMWSVGCILAELFMRQPLFPGSDERDQLAQIFRVLGTPADPTRAADGALVPGAGGGDAGRGKDGDEDSCWALVMRRRGRRRAGPAAKETDGASGTTASPSTALPPPATPAAASSGHAWPGVTLLPGYVAYQPRDPMPWSAIVPTTLFPNASTLGIDLLKRLLTMNPDARITAAEALRHPWFRTAPAPCSPASLPLPSVAYRHKAKGGSTAAAAVSR